MPVLVQPNLNFPGAEGWRTGRESYLKSNSAWRTSQGLEGAGLISVFRKMGAPHWEWVDVVRGQQGVGAASSSSQCLRMGGRGFLTQAGEGEQ